MNPPVSSPPKWLKGLGPVAVPKLDDRDAACMVLPDLDYDSQLAAIRQLLRHHQRADDELKQEIAEIEAFAKRTSGIRNEYAVEEWVNHLQHSVYQDAAHSMAALGMLAPMIESLFYQTFQGIRVYLGGGSCIPSGHDRWNQPAEDQWDCHYVWSRGRRSSNLVEGIMQLAEAIGLDAHLPNDTRLTLQALFEYRNKMFHNGFEWPIDERKNFAKRIIDAQWPADWFQRATQDDEPWVFYMSSGFIQHCVDTIDKVISGIGAFCNAKLYSTSRTREGDA